VIQQYEPLATTELRGDADVMLARRQALRLAELVQLDPQDQSRLAAAVSEIARNALHHGGGGEVEFGLGPDMVVARVTDAGPGIADVRAVLDGRAGGGFGITAARRMSDEFRLESQPGGGTTVELGKRLVRPGASIDRERIAEALSEEARLDAPRQLQRQHRELQEALTKLRAREADVERLSRELAETNRGVVALYAELDERAAELGRAAELKSRVLSDISHEVRTPLNAMVNVSRLLLDRLDGDLTPEQEHQVRLIRDSATSLIELVTDLLEMARMEAGKTVVRLSEFTVRDLFATLRGMFRPLLGATSAVALGFDEASHLTPLHTDETKVGQILRNLISNALKFTEAGEVRVSAELVGDDRIAFSVTDTGIGIGPADQERIFQEFSQVESPLQRRAQGTGLGLPLSRKLAEFLGGSLTVESAPGRGSTFTAIIPCRYAERRSAEEPFGGPERRRAAAVETQHA
jgi:signal transduction histidine kinase